MPKEMQNIVPNHTTPLLSTASLDSISISVFKVLTLERSPHGHGSMEKVERKRQRKRQRTGRGIVSW
jgi:hypothetical protein